MSRIKERNIFSSLQSEFEALVNQEIAKTVYSEEIFTKEELIKLPKPLQRFYEYCGWIGKPKMSNIYVRYNDVNFKFTSNKPALRMKYEHYNFAARPDRIAFIDAKMYGIPFQGIDKCIDGKGSMKGVIAKMFTLFNYVGAEMDRASFVTVLGEAIFIPSLFLQNFISFETLNELQIKVIIQGYDMQASGIFSFNQKGELISFTTDDRYMVDDKGKYIKAKWTAIAEDYKETVTGVKVPTHLKAVWNLPKGDLVYFDGKDIQITYDARAVVYLSEE